MEWYLALSVTNSFFFFKFIIFGDTWVAWSVKRPTLAQATISQSVGSSPTSGSVLTAQSPEPGLDSVSSSLSLPLPCSFSVSLCLKKKETLKIKRTKGEMAEWTLGNSQKSLPGRIQGDTLGTLSTGPDIRLMLR